MEGVTEGLSVVAAAGGVSGVGGLVGAMIGNRVDLSWIKRELAEAKATLKAHGKRLGQHDVKIAILEQGERQ